MAGTPIYCAWLQMRERCHNPGSPGFRWYGARGIKVCERWRESFEAFYADLGPRPSPRHSIDRIDNDGNYEPGNVRWATIAEQNANKRPRDPLLHRRAIAEGLARARSEGKRLGRPPIAPELEERIRKALAVPGRPGVRVIAKQFGVDPTTVQRISRPFEAATGSTGKSLPVPQLPAGGTFCHHHHRGWVGAGMGVEDTKHHLTASLGLSKTNATRSTGAKSKPTERAIASMRNSPCPRSKLRHSAGRKSASRSR